MNESCHAASSLSNKRRPQEQADLILRYISERISNKQLGVWGEVEALFDMLSRDEITQLRMNVDCATAPNGYDREICKEIFLNLTALLIEKSNVLYAPQLEQLTREIFEKKQLSHAQANEQPRTTLNPSSMAA